MPVAYTKRGRRDRFLDTIDLYATPVTTLNFEGTHRIHSYLGLGCTVITIIGLLTFLIFMIS